MIIRDSDKDILRVFATYPTWVDAKVYARLSGYPNPDVCWVWPKQTGRYGMVELPEPYKRGVLVHRVVWTHVMGPCPKHLELDHADENGCGNRWCANPKHLSAVTHQYNSAVTGTGPVAKFARTTHCPKGHPLVEGNFVRSSLSKGRRDCQTCHRERGRIQHDNIRAACRVLGITQDTYRATYGCSDMFAKELLGR